MKRKAVFPITSTNVPDKLVKCRFIHDSMIANAVVYPTPTVPMADFDDAIVDLAIKQAAMEYGGKDRTAVRNAALNVLNGMILRLLTYVNDVADGNVVSLVRSGFPLNKERTPSGLTPKMTILSVRPGPVDGSLTIETLAIKGVKLYNLSFSLAGPDGYPTTWSPDITFGKSRMELGGLESRKLYWIRTRAFANKSMGAYSDPYAGSTV